MTLHMMTKGAATYSNENLLSDLWLEESRYLRRVKRIGVVGSDDVNEISWKLSYGNREIAEGANLKEDSADLLAEDMQLCSSKLLLS